MENRLRKIILAGHYGFCMGVKRAIKIAEETGRLETGPVNVINEIVHNDAVVKKLADEGIGHVRCVDEAADGTVIISAHGAPPQVFARAREKGLKVVDATCPLVIRIHKTIQRLVAHGYQIIHFGDRDHDETIGVVGQAPERVHVVRTVDELHTLQPTGGKYALTAQTTAGVADFDWISQEAKKIFPGIEVFNTICNATSQRQAATLDIASEVDAMLVVGSSSSANSKRLRTISEAICGRAYLINSVDSLDETWLDGVTVIGLTAGASTPDFLVEEVIGRLLAFSCGTAEVIRSKKDTEEGFVPDPRKPA